MAETFHKSEGVLIKDTPYPTLTGEIWGVFCECFGENWPCYNGTHCSWQTGGQNSITDWMEDVYFREMKGILRIIHCTWKGWCIFEEFPWCSSPLNTTNWFVSLTDIHEIITSGIIISLVSNSNVAKYHTMCLKILTITGVIITAFSSCMLMYLINVFPDYTRIKEIHLVAVTVIARVITFFLLVHYFILGGGRPICQHIGPQELLQ